MVTVQFSRRAAAPSLADDVGAADDDGVEAGEAKLFDWARMIEPTGVHGASALADGQPADVHWV
jgi:hypothetical protein